MKQSRRVAARAVLGLLLGLTVTPGALAQKVSFREAIEKALAHSAGMGMAMADQIKARQGYLEARNMYVPQVTFGSGLAKTWGFPMSIEGSAPSVFQVNSQSFLYNAAQREFVRAAHTDWNAANLSASDQRAATVLETALTYMQFAQAWAKLGSLRQESQQAQRVENVSRERLQEGIDSRVDVKRAGLTAARIRLKLAEAQSNVDLLRQRLAQLTGLDPRELEVAPATIPGRPEINQQDDFVTRALENSPAVKAADQKALAREQRAKGEHKQLYPAIDLVGNYGLFSRYNNYDLYFQRFSRNNATAGVQIRVPFFNFSQRAHASAADADALRARKEAQAAREQIANDTLKLQRAIGQLAAARDVAQMEYELAQADVDAVQLKLLNGSGTIKDQENARIEVNDKYGAVLDAQFELDRAQLQLLRATGELEKWAVP